DAQLGGQRPRGGQPRAGHQPPGQDGGAEAVVELAMQRYRPGRVQRQVEQRGDMYAHRTKNREQRTKERENHRTENWLKIEDRGWTCDLRSSIFNRSPVHLNWLPQCTRDW